MHRSSFKRLFAQLPRQGTQHQHITVPGRAAQRHHAQRMDPRDKMSPTRQRERLVPKSPLFLEGGKEVGYKLALATMGSALLNSQTLFERSSCERPRPWHGDCGLAMSCLQDRQAPQRLDVI